MAVRRAFLLPAQANAHTVSDYWHTFKAFSQFLDGANPALSEIDKQSFTRFFASLADQGLSRKTVRNAHAGLSALWTWAVSEGIVEHNPLHDVRAQARYPRRGAILTGRCARHATRGNTIAPTPT